MTTVASRSTSTTGSATARGSDGLQAAFLAVKLGHLPTWTDARRRLADRYRVRLADRLVPWSDGAVHHLLVARVPADRRQEIRDGLGDAGVATGVHYPIPLSRQPSMAPWATSTPHAEAAADTVLSLPLDPLMGDDEVDFVADRFLELA